MYALPLNSEGALKITKEICSSEKITDDQTVESTNFGEKNMTKH